MSAALRVAMVTTSYPRHQSDFAGHFVASLAEEIVSQGHSVTVLAPHDAGAALEETTNGVRVKRVRYAGDSRERLAYGDGIVSNLSKRPTAALGAPRLALAMRGALRRLAADADVVHAHWAPTAVLAGAGAAGLPVALSLHGSDVTLAGKAGVWRSLLARGLATADVVNVVAEEQRLILLRRALFDGPISVIPNGVPPGLTRCRRPTHPASAPFTVAFVGRLVESKGVVDLLDAFATARRMSPETSADLRLVIAGKGPMLEHLQERARAEGVAEQVEFLGEVDHDRALEVTAKAHLLALPSHGEGCPLSVLEALALGTPVLGTRVGAIPELVGDAGRVLAVGDIPGLAEALLAFARDRKGAAALGKLARARVAADYTWPRIAARTLELYRAAIEIADVSA